MAVLLLYLDIMLIGTVAAPHADVPELLGLTCWAHTSRGFCLQALRTRAYGSKLSKMEALGVQVEVRASSMELHSRALIGVFNPGGTLEFCQ